MSLRPLNYCVGLFFPHSRAWGPQNKSEKGNAKSKSEGNSVMCSDRRRFERKKNRRRASRRQFLFFSFLGRRRRETCFTFVRWSDIFLFFCSTSLLREALEEILL